MLEVLAHATVAVGHHLLKLGAARQQALGELGELVHQAAIRAEANGLLVAQ